MKARDNPFSADRLDAIPYLPPDASHEPLVDRLKRMQFRCAIVGPHGSGKTTLLDQLARDLPAHGLRPHRIFLNDAHREVSPLIPARDDQIILLDGAEQLSRLQWKRFRRATAHRKLVITSHCPGLLPTLLATATTPALFEAIVERLIHPIPQQLRQRLPDVFDEHRGNLRDALRQLYDEYAGRPVMPAASPQSVHGHR